MTIRKIVNWIAGLPVAAAVAVFAVANRQWVTVSLDPIHRDQPFASVNMPLWALFFCGVFVGIFAGWLVAWMAQGKWRKAAREARLELIRTQNDNERVRKELASRAVTSNRDAA